MSDIKDVPPNTLTLFGIIGGLVGIYLSPYFPTAGALGAMCAVVWGADAVRRVAKYGLGTGVPSIGQLALGMGIIAAMFSLALTRSVTLAGPILALITASIIGLIIGWLAQNVIKMKIPVMIRGMTEIAAAGVLIILGYSATVAGNYVFAGIIPKVFDNGVILAIFWVGTLAMAHPFNACLGPDERQKRLLYLAVSTGAITMTLMGIAALMTLGVSGVYTIIVGIILWLISYKKFWDEVYKDVASVLGTGLLPKTEG
ncbi:MAG: tetrahydromethanopterin S-methyltransferase subunit C [Candidatus Methanoperedens sp.]|nr:tetrahydromethanopterin S-methyltransferase subunit C [Candidatus Methanoperedens sp.]